MKHILPILTAALALMTTALSADPTPFTYSGFTVTPKDYDNQEFQGIGNGDFYVVEFTADSKLYLIDHYNSLYGDPATGTETLKAMGITDYGYYKNGSSTLTDSFSLVKGNENYVEPESFTFSLDPSKTNGKDSLTRTGYLLGDFKTGDKVEIWMSDGYTSVSSNTLLHLATGGAYYGGRIDGRADMVTTYSSDGTVIPVAPSVTSRMVFLPLL